MARKTITATVDIIVPISLVYSYLQSVYSGSTIDLMKNYVFSLNRLNYKVIEDVPNDKLAIQTEYLFVKQITTWILNKTENGTEITIVIEGYPAIFSKFMPKFTREYITGSYVMQLKSLEIVYDIIKNN
ncbi:MAG: hypothetical protein SVM80_07440 [Halobacteriota archaeon]|nr:hypothetical protein [Halobacteriota archaeon]